MSNDRTVGQRPAKDADSAFERATQSIGRLQRSIRRKLGPFAGFVQMVRSIESVGDTRREGSERD